MARGGDAAIKGFYGLGRVKVLKGPLSIRYCNNTTGGVINVIPKKPQLGVTL